VMSALTLVGGGGGGGSTDRAVWKARHARGGSGVGTDGARQWRRWPSGDRMKRKCWAICPYGRPGKMECAAEGGGGRRPRAVGAGHDAGDAGRGEIWRRQACGGGHGMGVRRGDSEPAAWEREEHGTSIGRLKIKFQVRSRCRTRIGWHWRKRGGGLNS
jgi:hypothetical protein